MTTKSLEERARFWGKAGRKMNFLLKLWRSLFTPTLRERYGEKWNEKSARNEEAARLLKEWK